MGRRYLSFVDGLHRGIPQQTPRCKICHQHVSSQRKSTPCPFHLSFATFRVSRVLVSVGVAVRLTPTGVQRWKDMPGHFKITVEPHLRHHQHFNLHSILAR